MNRRSFLQVTAGMVALQILVDHRARLNAQGAQPGSTVETMLGRVRGLASPGVVAFKGLRYGASTAGAYRFQPPVKPAPWTGVRDAFEYGPRAWQPFRPMIIMVSVTNVEKSAAHYRKLFGAETYRDRNPDRVWFKLADSKLGLETIASGQKPGFSDYCVKVAGFDRAAATAKLTKLGLRVEAGSETGALRFRDLHNLPVEVVAG
jgi:hypothetical protein